MQRELCAWWLRLSREARCPGGALCVTERTGQSLLALTGGGEERAQTAFALPRVCLNLWGAGRGGGQIGYLGSLAVVLFWRHRALVRGTMTKKECGGGGPDLSEVEWLQNSSVQ